MREHPASRGLGVFVEHHGSGLWLPGKGEHRGVSGFPEGLRPVLGGRNPAVQGSTPAPASRPSQEAAMPHRSAPWITILRARRRIARMPDWSQVMETESLVVTYTVGIQTNLSTLPEQGDRFEGR